MYQPRMLGGLVRLKFDPSEDPVSPNAAFRQALLSVLQIRPRSPILTSRVWFCSRPLTWWWFLSPPTLKVSYLYDLAVELCPVWEQQWRSKTSSQRRNCWGVEAVLLRPKIIKQVIWVLWQKIKGLRWYKHRHLIKLQSKINSLANYSLSIRGKESADLLLFCPNQELHKEARDQHYFGHGITQTPHAVWISKGDQLGRELIRIDNRAVKSLPQYMTKSLKL